ncbi:MAG: PIG-L domain-containing protein [Acidobacteria bacterium]|nr:MAG: PIG-L domain-containing protein [Acidobacteriota bacterium]
MLSLGFRTQSDTPLRILCLGAHCDDIEIGCGGTILTLLETYRRTTVDWVVFSSEDQRGAEAHESANTFLKQAGSKNIVIKNFTNSFFPYIAGEIKRYFEELKRNVSPDLVFTHYRNDLHQDHRVISELAWNSFRNHMVLEYEIPKYDGDLGSPNSFVHLDQSMAERKISYILESFRSQRTKQWFDKETFLAMLRLRGMESNAPSRYAEAFYCRKAVLA